MMKKMLSLSALAAGILLSGQVLAAGANVSSGVPLTPTDCAVLDNNVTVQLSKNVVAGYTCSATAFRAGTCHTNGTNKTTTQTCTWTTEKDASGNDVVRTNFKECPAAAPADGKPVTVTASGRVGFRGGSGGGTVGATELGSIACDAAAVKTDVFMPAVL